MMVLLLLVPYVSYIEHLPDKVLLAIYYDKRDPGANTTEMLQDAIASQ